MLSLSALLCLNYFLLNNIFPRREIIFLFDKYIFSDSLEELLRTMKRNDTFYQSSKWKHLRSVILRRDGYMCQISRRYGKRIPADTVHHVFPREEYPEYQWQAWNLVSLASDVHNRMHDRNTNALTEEGAELLRRIARRHGVDVPPQYR